jgi:hypothetical protein
MKRVATIESVASSTRIEGAKLTDREVEQLFCRCAPRRQAASADRHRNIHRFVSGDPPVPGR